MLPAILVKTAMTLLTVKTAMTLLTSSWRMQCPQTKPCNVLCNMQALTDIAHRNEHLYKPGWLQKRRLRETHTRTIAEPALQCPLQRWHVNTVCDVFRQASSRQVALNICVSGYEAALMLDQWATIPREPPATDVLFQSRQALQAAS